MWGSSSFCRGAWRGLAGALLVVRGGARLVSAGSARRRRARGVSPSHLPPGGGSVASNSGSWRRVSQTPGFARQCGPLRQGRTGGGCGCGRRSHGTTDDVASSQCSRGSRTAVRTVAC